MSRSHSSRSPFSSAQTAAARHPYCEGWSCAQAANNDRPAVDRFRTAGSTGPIEIRGYDQCGIELVLDGTWLRRVERGSDGDVETTPVIDTRGTDLALLNRTKILNLNADEIRPAVSVMETPSLASSGRGLASVLATIALREPSSIVSISEEVSRVVPHAKAVRPDRVDSGSGGMYVFEVDFDGVGWIAGTEISEGTAIAIALITLLHWEDPPDLLLIDDIDRGLHPRAQAEVVGILRRVLERRPEMQIVATTHSPYLLDAFEPEEVCVLSLGSDGRSVCRRLADHPDIDKWREAMASGELWASVGEDWIREPAGGNRSDLAARSHEPRGRGVAHRRVCPTQ